MIKRILQVEKTENNQGLLKATLEYGGTESEETIEKELLEAIFKSDPALEENTGRLLPGKKISEIGLSLFLLKPNANGVSHLGGIQGNAHLIEAALQVLSKNGYKVKY
jgi:hypothetical protein